MQLLKNSETNCKYLIEEMCNSFFFLQAESNISKLEMQEISLNFSKNDHLESILEKLHVEIIYFQVASCFSVLLRNCLQRCIHGFLVTLVGKFPFVIHLLVTSTERGMWSQRAFGFFFFFFKLLKAKHTPLLRSEIPRRMCFCVTTLLSCPVS